jgi:wyosine [tRNA(Phe)-imidazoG37] synthetase (radical SAM superfamily)
VARFLERLRPALACVATPTRPPAEPWAVAADEASVRRCVERFARSLPRVERLTDFEGTAFGTTGGAAADLLAATAVHPMREDAALALLERAGADRRTLDRLVAEGRVRPVRFAGRTYYVNDAV